MRIVDAEVVAAARRWIGTPYRHQASCAGAGTDCLGLIRGVWREVIGREPVDVPPYTLDWSETQREESLWSAAETHLLPRAKGVLDPGTVVLFRMRDGAVAKHLGIVAAAAPQLSFVHAYSGHGVIESRLTAPWRRRIVAEFAFPERGT